MVIKIVKAYPAYRPPTGPGIHKFITFGCAVSSYTQHTLQYIKFNLPSHHATVHQDEKTNNITPQIIVNNLFDVYIGYLHSSHPPT